MKWRLFTAGEAEKITGMSPVLQRNKRLRNQLTPLPEGVMRAALNPVLLGEMIFVGDAAKLGIGTIENVTVRSAAGRWIAYWALQTPKGLPLEDRDRLARKMLSLSRDKQAPRFAVVPIEGEANWNNVAWTNDPISAMRGRTAVVVDLKKSGEDMAAKAGALVESGDD
ncbi:MAG: hypothetical protein ACOY5F_21955 [Pseudomonadota bacterium]